MAEKMIFLASQNKAFEEDLVEYDYHSGMAVCQKKKNIKSLHDAISKKYPNKRVLEISTKSEMQLGVDLSAFNLQYYHDAVDDYRNVENVYQSSKVFQNGGPYIDLLNVTARQAKKDDRLKTSGDLIAFELDGVRWPCNNTSVFYDWIYIAALMNNPDLSSQLVDYDIFTDIEFNYKKSFNCQARSAAIYVSLYRAGLLKQKTSSRACFESIYSDYFPSIVGVKMSNFGKGEKTVVNKMILFYSEKKENGYLSNWYPAEFDYDGYHYKTSEQYMMHQKALLFGDKAVAKKILKTEDQKEIKYLGREVTPFDNDTWNENRVEIVYKGLLEKFRQNDDLKEQLLATGDAILVEASPWDRIWGIGLRKDDPKAQDPKTWRGKNLLGYTLMRVRETICEEEGKDMVYVSKGGKKYHMPGCTYAKGGKRMKKKCALNQGMEPCSKCCF